MITNSTKRYQLILKSLLGGLLLIWAIYVLQNFIYRDPPFRWVIPFFVKALLSGRLSFPLWSSFWVAVLQALLFFGLAAIPGWLLIRRRISPLSWMETFAVAVSLGWGLWMILVELFAIFHLLHRWSLLLCWVVLSGGCWLLSHQWKPSQETVSPEESVRWKTQRPLDKGLWIIGFLIIFLITYYTFYHALVFPVVYWDSLILYVDYGEQTFLEKGFPVMVCGQVGLALGANYPHLFPLTAASMGTLWGSWQDLHAQFISPFAGLLAILLLYALVLKWSTNHLLALLAVLVFRSIPYATFYFIFATDYAVAILLTTLFLWGAWIYLNSENLCGLAVAAIAVAIGMHLNYLMGILWLTLILLPVLQKWQNGATGNLRAFWPRPIIGVFLTAALLGSGWYIRNIIVTGNPVYAFFPKIFGGKNINLEVLESCFQEWRHHGDGIGRFGNTLGAKLAGLPHFLLVETNYHWKLGPVFTALAIPGIFFCFRRKQGILIAALIIFISVMGYHFFIADIYLYHTLMILPVVSLMAVAFLSALNRTLLYYAFVLWMLIAGVYAGLAPALVGGKWHSFRPFAIELPSLLEDNQASFRDRFLQYSLKDSYRMWTYINENLPPAKILTHENRHHYLARRIELVGLDDCRLTDWYDLPFDQVADRLRELGIEYYLKIPQELHHPITQRLGVGSNLEEYFDLIHSEGNEELYRLK